MKTITSRVLIAVALATAFAFAGSAPTAAQTGSATSLTGHIKDPQGANLPGATVTLYARDRAAGLTTITDSTGTYRFERLAQENIW